MLSARCCLVLFARCCFVLFARCCFVLCARCWFVLFARCCYVVFAWCCYVLLVLCCYALVYLLLQYVLFTAAGSTTFCAVTSHILMLQLQCSNPATDRSDQVLVHQQTEGRLCGQDEQAVECFVHILDRRNASGTTVVMSRILSVLEWIIFYLCHVLSLVSIKDL